MREFPHQAMMSTAVEALKVRGPTNLIVVPDREKCFLMIVLEQSFAKPQTRK
jgi:hypothetical protein